MAWHRDTPLKKKTKTVPKGMPKHLDNPDSDYQRKTDYKLGKQTVKPILKEDFQKMQRLCLIHRQKAEQGSDEEYRWYRNYVMMMLGVNLGNRVTTIANFTPRNVAGGHLTVKEHKTGKVFEMTLRDNLNSLVQEYISYYNITTDEYMFRAHLGSKMKPISRQTCWNYLNSKDGLAYEAGVKYVVGAYSLRKSYARWVYDDTKDIFKVMRLLKHSDPIITARYIGLEEEEVQKLRAKIEFGFDEFK